MKLIEQHQIFGGSQQVWTHNAQTLQCEMKFAVYLPNNPENRPLGVIYWLSGLTCTEQNFITKSGFQRYAAEHQVIVVAPDTSPRGEQVPNDVAYDLGQGAGFYLNATEQPWATNYQMYDYILNELPDLIEANFLPTANVPLWDIQWVDTVHWYWHCETKNVIKVFLLFFAHFVAKPCALGRKSLFCLFREDREKWQQYDASSLIQQGYKVQGMHIDQGLKMSFTDTIAYRRFYRNLSRGKSAARCTLP